MIGCKLPPKFPLALHFHRLGKNKKKPVTLEVTGSA
jgi:hypothetical protein